MIRAIRVIAISLRFIAVAIAPASAFGGRDPTPSISSIRCSIFKIWLWLCCARCSVVKPYSTRPLPPRHPLQRQRPEESGSKEAVKIRRPFFACGTTAFAPPRSIEGQRKHRGQTRPIRIAYLAGRIPRSYFP